MSNAHTKLAEAREAYHALMTGTAASVLVDGSTGERVEYVRVSAPKLAAYIRDLENLVAGRSSRPAVLHLSTSKGLS